MEPTMIIALGRLLYDVAKMVLPYIIETENNPSLDSGDKKHRYVEQAISKEIDDIDIREQVRARNPNLRVLTNDEVTELKERAKAQITPSIKKTVNTLNEVGYFIKGD